MIKREDYGHIVADERPARAMLLDLSLTTMSRNVGPKHYPRHRHAEHELLLIEAGQYHCTINDQLLELDCGQALFVQPGDVHEDRIGSGSAYAGFRFHLRRRDRGDEAIRLLADDIALKDRVVTPSSGLVADLFRHLSASSGQFNGMVQHHLAAAVFWDAIRDVPQEQLSLRARQLLGDADLLDRLYRVFAEHDDRNCSVTELAAPLGLSSSGLAHACKRLCGQGPVALHSRFRLCRAREQLRHSEERIQAIAERCGFSNAAHFAKAYRRLFGHAPSQERG